MNCNEIISLLKSKARPDALIFMKRYGIDTDHCYAVSIPDLRSIAKSLGKNNVLAAELWKTGIHDARILASMLAEPKEFKRKDAIAWSADFRSWDLCDQVCMNLFRKCDFAIDLAYEFIQSEHEFQKRAGFVIMATGAVHWKSIPEKIFINFLPEIERASTDPRNYVKKGVNWALRQIGKRNLKLKNKVIECCNRLLRSGDKTAGWNAHVALKDINK